MKKIKLIFLSCITFLFIILQNNFITYAGSFLTSEEIINMRNTAHSLVGLPYKTQSTNPEIGFDCDALIHYIYKKSLGLKLPLSTKLLDNFLKEVPTTDIRVGDIIGYDAKDDGQNHVTHVGLYLGKINTKTGQYDINGEEMVIHSAPNEANSTLANINEEQGVDYISLSKFKLYAGNRLKVFRPNEKTTVKVGDYQVIRSYRLYTDNSYEYSSYLSIPDGVKNGDIIRGAIDDGDSSIRFKYLSDNPNLNGKEVFLRKVAVVPIKTYYSDINLLSELGKLGANYQLSDIYVLNKTNIYSENNDVLGFLNPGNLLRGVSINRNGVNYIRYYDADEGIPKYIKEEDTTNSRITLKISVGNSQPNIRRVSDNSIIRYANTYEKFIGYITWNKDTFYGQYFVFEIENNGKKELAKLPISSINILEVNESIDLNGWKVIDGNVRYYINGKALKGLQKIGNTTYLFDSFGNKQMGWHVLDGKALYFSPEYGGGLITGKRKIGNTVYLLTEQGKKYGWHVLNGEAYYFDANYGGGLVTGKRKIGNTTYLLTSSGKKYGWHVLNGKKYYFDPNYGGGMVTGTRKIGNATYLFSTEHGYVLKQY